MKDYKTNSKLAPGHSGHVHEWAPLRSRTIQDEIPCKPCLKTTTVCCVSQVDQGPDKIILILFAFMTGNSSLKPLLEGVLSQIHMDVSSVFGLD